jgi:hypothetical protein
VAAISSRARLVLPVVLGLALVASLVLSAVRMSRVPSEAALDGVADEVRRGFRPGDIVLTTPPWMAGVQARLGDLPLLPMRDLEPAELDGFGRVWLVEVRATGADDRVRRALSGLGHLTDVTTSGDARLARVTLTHPRAAVLDLWRDLARVRVLAHYAGNAEGVTCGPWSGQAWPCPRSPEWSYVGREVHALGNVPRPCVWAHPLPPGGVLRLELPALPSPSAPRSLALAFGFVDEVLGRARAPVSLRVTRGGEVLWRGQRPVVEGVGRVELPLRDDPAPLALELETTDERAAHFCLSATVLDGSRS